MVRHESSLFMSWQALVVPGRHLLMVGGQRGVPRYPVVVTPSFLVQGSPVVERTSLGEPERRIVPARDVGIMVLGPGWHLVVSGMSLIRVGMIPAGLRCLVVVDAGMGEPMC